MMRNWQKSLGSMLLWTASLLVALPAQGVLHAAAAATVPAGSSALNTGAIERAAGRAGTMDHGVFKITVPRRDLAVDVAGVKLVPAMGLTSWAAFTRASDHAVVMGDLTLSEGQVNPVMSVALDNGLAVTALHNHFFWESPRVMFMHIAGRGSEAQLGAAVGKVLAAIEQTSKEGATVPRVAIDPAKTSLDPRRIEAILGAPGQLQAGVYKVTVGRTTRMDGLEMGTAMGVNTWAAFAGSDQQAVVDGDFAMLESELQPVLKALRAAGINIVAIHQHMVGEEPRILFLHYWGVGRTEDLARGLRHALDQTASRPPTAG